MIEEINNKYIVYINIELFRYFVYNADTVYKVTILEELYRHNGDYRYFAE